MFGQLLSGIGAKIGGTLAGQIGGGILSSIGRFAGSHLGGYLGRYIDQKRQKTQHFFHYDKLKENFQLTCAKYGEPIPLTFGKMRLPGKIIWSDQLRINQISEDSVKKFYQSPHKTQAVHHNIEYEYYLSFAMALCEGEIVEIARVWVGDELVDLSNYKFCLYNGSEEQMPDPLIQSKVEEGAAPAFRGIAYIVFEDVPLADFNDNVPNFSFEVIRKANIKQDTTVEDLVKSMIMIPGSGEFVYDTIIQTKTIKNKEGYVVSRKSINSHNHFKIANSIHSLNQLENTCSNIEWIAPVACWFGTSLDIADCKILPAIEFRKDNVEYSEEWKVADYNRSNAHEISKDDGRNPNYGGSVNDASIVRYLEEIRKRGKKIMFYPMFLLDVPMKPWRGHLTGDATKISGFFNKKGGYNEFILHYANLVKNHVDAFIIGSELIGLTKIRGRETTCGIEFPAIDELLALSSQVKQIVGSNVLVSYAADWSEYHHTEGGWYNLDPLWASSNIDFIGIDAYFPATNNISSAISDADLADGWMSGEGYDYYVDANRNKQPLAPRYAWKNLRHWHENEHINPNNIKTDWIPKSKKIWFTEYGFPSIDKASNQPNVFFDPLCSDGGIPKHSTGETNFTIQRKAVRAFIEYWSTQEYVEQMFLWTWDARPYPAWPHMNIWKDGRLWEKGHWVNSKFGACSIAAVILEISKRCEIDLNMINVANVDECLEGVIFNQQISGLSAISNFRATHFFDIICNNKGILFLKRTAHYIENINSGDLIKLSKNSYLKVIEVPKTSIIGKINMYFINNTTEYNSDYMHVNNECETYRQDVSLSLSILLGSKEAESIGRLILQNARGEHSVIHFKLPITYLYLKPSDFISFIYLNVEYSIRIIDINLVIEELVLEVTGVADDINTYLNVINILPFSKEEYKELIEPEFVVLDLPFPAINLGSQLGNNTPYIAIYLKSQTKKTLYYKSSASVDSNNNWRQLTSLIPSNSIYEVIEFKSSKYSNIFMIDNVSNLYIRGKNLHQNLAINGQWNIALVGREFVYFKDLTILECLEGEDCIYQITTLQRGQFGSEEFIDSHIPDSGEKFVIIASGYNLITISANIIFNQKLSFKIGASEEEQNIQDFIFQNKSKILPKPYITESYLIGESNILKLSWVMRSFNNSFWKQGGIQKKYKYTVIISDDEGEKYREENVMETNISINLSGISLSGRYKTDILVIQ